MTTKKNRAVSLIMLLCSILLIPFPVSAAKKVNVDTYLKKGKNYTILAYNNTKGKRIKIRKSKSKKADTYSSLEYGGAVIVNTSKLKKGKKTEWIPVYLHNRKSGNSYKTGYVLAVQVKLSAIYKKKFSNNAIINKAIKTGFRYLGTPFILGGSSLTSGIDCSNFVNTCYRIGGKYLVSWAHTSPLQNACYPISKSQLKAGDLIFYYENDNPPHGSIGHVSMYIGKGFVIHASGHYGVTYPQGGICIKRINYGARVAARYMRPR